MSESIRTVAGLIEHLRSAHLIDEEGADAIASHSEVLSTRRVSPWFVNLLVGIGAWLASIAFVIAVGSLLVLTSQAEMGEVNMTIGGIGILIAIVLHWLSRKTEGPGGVFVTQLALALSVAGHFGFLFGFYMVDEGRWTIATGASMLLVILYPVYRDAIHRFFSTALVLGTVMIALMVDQENLADMFHLWFHLYMVVVVALIGLVFLDENIGSRLRPAGYAAALALVVVPGIFNGGNSYHILLWPSQALLIAALVLLYLRIASKLGGLRPEPTIVMIAATLAVGLLSPPGVTASIVLLVLGYYRNDRILIGLAAIAAIVHLIFFYNDLHLSLLTKSWLLGLVGAVMLGARGWLRWYGRREESV